MGGGFHKKKRHSGTERALVLRIIDEQPSPIEKLHEGTRKSPRPGDIFIQRLVSSGLYITGLVAKEKVGYASKFLLLYFANIFSKERDLQVGVEAFKDNLLIPPLITNRQGWLKGYFQTIKHAKVNDSALLPVHCFEGNQPGTYYNEYEERLQKRTEPCGFGGIWGLLEIADTLVEAVHQRGSS